MLLSPPPLVLDRVHKDDHDRLTILGKRCQHGVGGLAPLGSSCLSSPNFRALLGEAKPRACSLEGVNELNVFQQEPQLLGKDVVSIHIRDASLCVPFRYIAVQAVSTTCACSVVGWVFKGSRFDPLCLKSTFRHTSARY